VFGLFSDTFSLRQVGKTIDGPTDETTDDSNLSFPFFFFAGIVVSRETTRRKRAKTTSINPPGSKLERILPTYQLEDPHCFIIQQVIASGLRYVVL
jgi:hypothetical protein